MGMSLRRQRNPVAASGNIEMPLIVHRHGVRDIHRYILPLADDEHRIVAFSHAVADSRDSLVAHPRNF